MTSPFHSFLSLGSCCHPSVSVENSRRANKLRKVRDLNGNQKPYEGTAHLYIGAPRSVQPVSSPAKWPFLMRMGIATTPSTQRRKLRWSTEPSGFTGKQQILRIERSRYMHIQFLSKISRNMQAYTGIHNPLGSFVASRDLGRVSPYFTRVQVHTFWTFPADCIRRTSICSHRL